MIHLFLHCDEFLAAQRLAEIKQALGDPEMASINTTELNEKTSVGEILAQASAMPFLSERRLVIVRGFLSNLDKRMAASKNPSSAAHIEAAKLLDGLSHVPETCDLILVDNDLDKRRGLWKGFTLPASEHGAERRLGGIEALSKARHVLFEMLATPDAKVLPGWIQQRAKEKQVVVDGRAVQMLADFVGADLRRLDNELDKLSLYADGRPISVDDVRLMVSDTGEEMIWNLTDALSQRNGRAAMRTLAELWRSDQNPFGLLGSIAKHYRLIIRVKTLMQQRVNNEFEIAKALNEKPLPVKKAMQATARYSFTQLDDIMERLLDANMAMTTGADQETEIDVLVAELTIKKE